MEKSVSLKIKSPSARYEDLEFSCDIGSTVAHVKTRIAEQFPTRPLVSAQKLVYSGKILKDADKLREFLRFEDNPTKFTFHLVCSVPQNKPSPVAEQPTTATLPDGLRQRHGGGAGAGLGVSSGAEGGEDMDQMMRDFSTQYTEAMASLNNNPSEADMAAMQELYTQYLSLYMQYVQAQAFPQAATSSLQVPGHVNLHQDAGPAVPEAEVGADGGPNNPGPGPAMVMNAGAAAAGPIQDVGGAAGDRQRDILDWVYVMTRVMLLISVIYFHSSFLRLAFVAGLGFLVYLYQNRLRQPIRHQPPPPQPAQQQAAQDQDRNNTEDAAEESAAEEAEEIIIEEPSPSKFAVLVTFFTSLVSSIIPEQPQVI